MLKFNKSFDGKIFGMSKRRRAQFPAVAAVVEALIAAVPPICSVTFCAGGNREGALMMILPTDFRESNPFAAHEVAVDGPVALPSPRQSASLQGILDTILTAFPPDLDLASTATIFGFQLGTLYASRIWSHLGDDPDTNAAAAIHEASSCPDAPGLTHLTRAVLGVTLCAR
ncbi:hypothetical protein VTK26DRAFT_8530 [Humicola hyalothermophila]